MEKKYIMTDATDELVCGKVLHRIQAVRDFGDVKKGDLGGFIEKEDNLSHEGDCWVYDDAMVRDNATVYDNATVHETACICDNAKIFDNAYVGGSSIMADNAQVFGNANVYDFVWAQDSSKIYGDAEICGQAFIFHDVQIYGDANIRGYASIFDDAHVSGSVKICGEVTVHGDSQISENVQIGGHTEILWSNISGNVSIMGGWIMEGNITKSTDYVGVDTIGIDSQRIVFYRNKRGDVIVSTDLFDFEDDINLKDFEKVIEDEFGESGSRPNSVNYKHCVAAMIYARTIME